MSTGQVRVHRSGGCAAPREAAARGVRSSQVPSASRVVRDPPRAGPRRRAARDVRDARGTPRLQTGKHADRSVWCSLVLSAALPAAVHPLWLEVSVAAENLGTTLAFALL